MTDRYHDGQREFQDRFDTRRLADRLAEAASETFNEDLAKFVEARDMFFIASTGDDGRPDCSYKGGDPGFVRVIDDATLAFPVFDGNGMFRTLGNLRVNPQVGLLFVDFETGTRLRVNGEASIDLDDPLTPRFKVRCASCGSGPDRSSPIVAGTCTSIARCRRHHSCRATRPIRPSRTGSSTRGSTARSRADDPALDPEPPERARHPRSSEPRAPALGGGLMPRRLGNRSFQRAESEIAC